ncbi:MAG: M6 family metalloprotease domain-containing protein [Nanoarchaeota archaeon]|nr:M6 family metalloprotease domain-containing protein [Nanoarchaeota archaeon]
MKRGVLVLFVLIISISSVLAIAPSNEEIYDCGNDIPCVDLTSSGFLTETYVVDDDVDFGEVVSGKTLGALVAFEKDELGERKAFLAELDVDGYAVARKDLPVKDLSLNQIREQAPLKSFDAVRVARPQMPPPIGLKPEGRWQYDRLKINAENEIGLIENKDTGEYENYNPIVKEKVEEEGEAPPNLPLPAPTIIPTGLVTAEQNVQTLKILVVLVQFPDQSASTSVSEIESLFDGFVSFFDEESYGSLNLEVTVLPTWYTASESMGSYGGNYESNIESLIEEAVELADPAVDYSQYDSDGDGIVDGFFVVHAGEADEENGGGNGDEIWSHYYSISGKTVDGVQVIDYETVSEESPQGIMSHEFGHYLGLPDFYDTVMDDGSSKGVGDWALMAYGAYTDDPSFSPWSKKYLGWLSDDNFVEISEDGYYDLTQDKSLFGVKYYSIPLNTDEYFMIENRHVQDLMKENDAGGILIWHVDESLIDETGSWNGCASTRWECNTVNGDSSHKMLDLEEADGKEELSGDNLGDKEDPWYYSCGTFGGCQANVFYYASSPTSEAYTSTSYDVAVTVNSEIGDTMSLGISLAGEVLSVEEVEEVSGSVSVEESTEESVSSSPTSSGGIPGWLYAVAGVLILVILISTLYLGFVMLKKH